MAGQSTCQVVILLFFLTNAGTFAQTLASDKEHNLTIVALLPMTGGWNGGTAMLAAMELALDNINSRTDILPNYHLQIVYNDTQFKVYEGIHVLHRFLQSRPTKMAVLGAANSELSQAAATYAELYNLVTVSYASVTPLLSDKETYPYFFRTSAPDTVVNPARIAIMKLFGWTKAAAIIHSRTVFDAVIQDLKERFAKEHFMLLASEVFTDTPKAQMKALKHADARIIFAECNKDKAVMIFCEAYKLGMYGPKYAWFFPGWFDDGWWRTTEDHDCTIAQMEKVAEGYFSPGDVVRNPNPLPGISGITSTEYDRIFNEKTNYTYPFATTLSTQAYDAVWALALAFNATHSQLEEQATGKTLVDFNYEKIIGSRIYENMRNVTFEGVKAPIVFDKNQDPVIMVKLQRVQNGAFQTVAIYRPDKDGSDNWQWFNETPLIWPGGHPPADSTTVILQESYVTIEAYVIIITFASLLILIACCFLIINYSYRNTRIIKMSSPNINNVVLLGCIILYITVFLQARNRDHVTILCTLRTFTISLGYSLAFGGLFSKTWRIHVIFANKQLKKKVVKDSKLLGMVAILIIIDLVILLTWTSIDPFYIRIYNTFIQVLPEGDTIIQHQVAACESQHHKYFLWTLIVVKGLLLLFGAFLAWETRNVKIPALNDSKQIGMCIYNTALLAIVIFILSLAITNNVQLEYVIMSVFLIMAATLTQMIIFVPKLMKLHELRVNPEADEEYTKGKGVQGSTMATALSSTVNERVVELERKLQAALNALAIAQATGQAKENEQAQAIEESSHNSIEVAQQTGAAKPDEIDG